jgi:ATP-dependent DNA ligase
VCGPAGVIDRYVLKVTEARYLTGLLVLERRRLLDGLGLVGPAWATNGWYCDGDTLFAVCAEHHHEGVVAKRLDSPYLPGRRTRTWLKRKTPEWKLDHAPRRRPRVGV